MTFKAAKTFSTAGVSAEVQVQTATVYKSSGAVDYVCVDAPTITSIEAVEGDGSTSCTDTSVPPCTVTGLDITMRQDTMLIIKGINFGYTMPTNQDLSSREITFSSAINCISAVEYRLEQHTNQGQDVRVCWLTASSESQTRHQGCDEHNDNHRRHSINDANERANRFAH